MKSIPEEKKAEETVEISAKDFFNSRKESELPSGSKLEPVSVPIPKPSKPKTELEVKIEERKDQHPAEKKDLFKAIFDDSEDDEEDDDEKVPENKPVPPEILSALTKPAAEVNLLRNTSPPRGIFAALFSEKPKEKSVVFPEQKK
uniref:Uncharacterized protein n=1 Tax=Megaselia scalaris TaxID=36166 RepID=T1GJ47_MEGSC